ncbi:TetR/AcrR family transcriptional regulator [Mesorhizobium sp. CGMCC 1.15528]|uniref:TetR/AcrR family transcriptional regulator n=1 Tax=Mesorhizobium zhangyense TaxID=1776730 RepID=A0A7C9R8S8_9HYPH|nr:TetR family transcriptional regulator [Mesorhizobium zhangyense]NGN42917.1 TetR/AcrR family transcriptional regulator [Mesorhizobium zhangyense]
MSDIADRVADSSRQENVNRILDAADRLFRHYGYSKTNVADIARDLGMSPANIYRFFGSKSEIHQALMERMLTHRNDLAMEIARLPISAEERLRRYGHEEHQFTINVLTDQKKVHEMVVVALEHQWGVIEKHIDQLHIVLAKIISDGIAAGEFVEQDPEIAARCFGASMVALCHPQVAAQCMNKENRATADELIEFAIRALKK